MFSEEMKGGRWRTARRSHRSSLLRRRWHVSPQALIHPPKASMLCFLAQGIREGTGRPAGRPQGSLQLREGIRRCWPTFFARSALCVCGVLYGKVTLLWKGSSGMLSDLVM